MEKNKKRRFTKAVAAMVMFLAGASLSVTAVRAEAATEQKKEQAKQEMIDIFYSADTSEHSFWKYLLTVSEFEEIYEELKNGEHGRMLGAYEADTYLKEYAFGKYVYRVKLVNEDTDALNRYARVNENADAILAGIEPAMDDVDKVIYLHDAIVELVSYGKTGNQAYTLGGALGDGKAVCKGYALALNRLLQEAGFETDYIRNATLNHGWSYVKLDGEWYHIDATWDDTQSPVKGQTSRQFLLRNEAEFMAEGKNSHETDLEHDGGSPVSLSTKYEDWFVHDVVGTMAFEDGLWYFVDPVTKDIVCADADGSTYEVVLAYTGEALEVVDAEDGVLVYTVAGERFATGLSERADGTTGGVAEETQLQEAKLNDYAYWCEGMYTGQAEIETCTGYFSTRACYAAEGGATYVLTLQDTRFRVILYEFDEQYGFLGKTELSSGETHTMNAATSYVGLSAYLTTWRDMSWADFAKKLEYQLHSMEISKYPAEEAEAVEELCGAA